MALTPVFYIEDGTFYLEGKMDCSEIVGNPFVQSYRSFDEHISISPSTGPRMLIANFSISYSGYSSTGFTPVLYVNGVRYSGGQYGTSYPVMLDAGVAYDVYCTIENTSGFNMINPKVLYQMQRQDILANVTIT